MSKEASPFPSVGNIRTIAILPLISKLYERVILSKLQKEIKDKSLIHYTQCGFREGKSTLHNLKRLIEMLNDAKAKATE